MNPLELEAEESLAHLASYWDLFQRMRDSVFLLDFDSFDILDSNPAVDSLLGLTREQAQGKSILTWTTNEHREEFLRALRMAKRRYYPRTSNFEWRRPDGQTLFVEVMIVSLWLSNNKQAIQVIAKDITRLHEAEQKNQIYLRELEALNKKLEELSTTDEMTKLPNFRYFKTRLKEEHDRCVRYNNVYSIVFFDVDNFKHYNDRNGHPAGDALLRELGRLISKSSRKVDIPARYGGEEFAMLLPEADHETAMIIAERFRELVAGHPFEHAAAQPLGKISVSVGVATFPMDGKTHEEVLEAADQAVYRSKRGGRNRVTSSQNK